MTEFSTAPFSRRGLLASALGVGAGILLNACSSGDDSAGTTTTQVDLEAELQKPATLTVWSWVAMTDQIKLFTAKYPNIKVNLVNAGQGSAEYTKFRTALQAKSGLPDVVQLEFNHLPSFSLIGALTDLTPYGAAALESTFNPSSWKQNATGGKVWALPMDAGPMLMLYRRDIFEQHNIAVPKTWDEFATAARALHKAAPGTYLTNFPPANTGPLFGLNLQAGSHPYTIKSPTELTIAINDAAAKNVAGFWTPLIQDGSVSVDPDFTDSWFKGLASGKYATWLTAAWGPYFLTSSAATTAGKWGAAQLPQWTAGQNVSGYWGGSSLAVVKGSGSAAAAAGFVKFMTTDAATTRALSDKQHLYPTTTALLQDKTFLGTADPFYGGQKVNELLATISAGAAANYEWSPLEGYISSSITDTFGKAVTAKTDLGAGLDAWEQAVVAYGKDQGFTVNG